MPQLHSEARNFYELFYSVRRKLMETVASRYTDLEIFGWLNKAQQFIARKSLCLEKEVAVTTTEGTREYNLRTTTNPFSDIIDISEGGVNYDVNGSASNNQPLDFTTIARLNKETPGWRSVSNSIPQKYYFNKATKTIGLYPEPNAANAGLYLHINGYRFGKTLIAGTASSGSTTTLVMKAGTTTIQYPSTTDDYYNGLYVEIYSGTGAGQKLLITNYVATTRTLTFATATAPDGTSVFGMVPEISEEAHYLMELYGLWKALAKGGSRVTLANNYRQEFVDGLGMFIGETIQADDEMLVRESYR